MEGMILSFHFNATACALYEQTLSPHFHRNETLLLLLDDWRSKVGCVECAMPCPVLSHLSNGPGGRFISPMTPTEWRRRWQFRWQFSKQSSEDKHKTADAVDADADHRWWNLVGQKGRYFFCHKQHFFLINNNECFIIVFVCRRNQSKSIVIINLIKHIL